MSTIHMNAGGDGPIEWIVDPIDGTVNYFFGTAPWFSLYPVGSLDKVRADKGDRYTRWKMDRAKLQRTLEHFRPVGTRQRR